MRSLKYFISFIPFFLTTSSYAEDVVKIEKKCGEFLFQVIIANGSSFIDRQFTLYFQKTGKKKKIFYQAEPGMLIDTACIKNKENEDLFIFREECTGSACPEDIYGVFDPKTEKILINPFSLTKNNIEAVEALTGMPLDLAGDEDSHSYFCCEYEQYTKKAEEELELSTQLKDSSDATIATAGTIAANQIKGLQEIWF